MADELGPLPREAPDRSVPAVPTLPTAPEPAAATAPATDAGRSGAERTRASTTYVGVAGGLLVLVVIIVFIAQNLHNASVHFVSVRFQLPIGVIVLAAVVGGGLIVFLVSLVRMLQLRRSARRSPTP